MNEMMNIENNMPIDMDVSTVNVASADVCRYGSIMSGIRKAIGLPPVQIDEYNIMAEVYKNLSQIDVSANIKKKQGLSYLSWARAWELVMEQYPDANYDVITFDGKPYFDMPNVGCVVFTVVTIAGVTRFMWLPVMDMRNKPVSVAEQGGMDSMQLNKTIMRCLVKNLAVFGLGLNLYYGEDISDAAKEENERKSAAAQTLDAERKRVIEIVSAMPKEQIDAARDIIAANNDGERNPKKIKTVEACAAIIAQLKEMEEK